MKNLFGSVLLLITICMPIDVFARQMVLFCPESYTYDSYTGDIACKMQCDARACGLNDNLESGWKIDLSIPKEVVTTPWGYKKGCTCKGTEYVLSQAEADVNHPQGADTNTQLIERENALLRREIELMKREIQMLRK